MYISTNPAASIFPPPPPVSANASYSFLAQPPKNKHKPQPITVRCTSRTLPRPTSSRRRASLSGSPAFQSNFISQIDTPTPTTDAPRTPHLTTHGYTEAFSTSYQRRGSYPDTPHSARCTPGSPKCSSKSASNSPKHPPGSGSPKRRRHHAAASTSPFAPPSPTRSQGRPRAKSTTRVPTLTPAHPQVLPTPKLSKFRSFTKLRSRSPSPPASSSAKLPMSSSITNTTKQTQNRSRRSATPAKGSKVYAKYRPMAFIKEMELIQFLEGGSMDSLIRRHHVHTGQDAAHSGSVNEVAHGYAFTDENGMVWFDEEEEWEFACLLPQARPQRKRGIKRILGKTSNKESENEWEDFAQEDEDNDLDLDMLAGRDDLRAGQDDLAAFGGALVGTWARERPERSVLKLPEAKHDRRSKRRHIRPDSSMRVTSPIEVPTPALAHTAALRQEFLATGFAPSATSMSPSEVTSSTPTRPLGPARVTSSFRLFGGKSQHHARSVLNANTKTNLGEAHSFSILGASLRGGSALDVGPDVRATPAPTIQWAESSSAATVPPPLSEAVSHQPSLAPKDVRMRSVSPPLAAARRLGIAPATTVSLQPPTAIKKPSFMSMQRHRN